MRIQKLFCNHPCVFKHTRTSLQKATFCVTAVAPTFGIGSSILQEERKKERLQLSPSCATNCFRDNVKKSFRRIELELKPPRGIMPIKVRCDVLNVDISPLLGLSILDEHILAANTVLIKLAKHIIVHGNITVESYMCHYCLENTYETYQQTC